MASSCRLCIQMSPPPPRTRARARTHNPLLLRWCDADCQAIGVCTRRLQKFAFGGARWWRHFSRVAWSEAEESLFNLRPETDTSGHIRTRTPIADPLLCWSASNGAEPGSALLCGVSVFKRDLQLFEHKVSFARPCLARYRSPRVSSHTELL